MSLSAAPTADASRLTWIITLGLICAMFVVCLIIVVRGRHVGRHAVQTRTQKLRIMRARHGLWALSALILLTVARIFAATIEENPRVGAGRSVTVLSRW